jgi:purine nucleosidase
VGTLFAVDPAIPAMLRQLVLMCGRFFTAMGGEWNAIGDPHATAITYGQGCQSRPPRHVSFGLDVTTRCNMTIEDCRRRFTANALRPVRDFAEVWYKGAKQITYHDPLAAACIFEPDICRYRQGKVSVSLDQPTMGWTVLDPNAADKPHTVAAEVDPEAFFRHYFDVVR